eukprot:99600-Alexandrium_andersonii.AAC.1
MPGERLEGTFEVAGGVELDLLRRVHRTDAPVRRLGQAPSTSILGCVTCLREALCVAKLALQEHHVA